MISVLVLCALISLSFQAQDIVNFNPHEEECIKELYGDKNHLLQQLFARKLFIENNEIVKNVVACSWKKEGIINENGEIVFDNFNEYLINSFRKMNGCSQYLAMLIAGDTVNYCKDITGSTSADTAVKISNCILRKNTFILFRINVTQVSENILRLSVEEEECIVETNINRDTVLADKFYKQNHKDLILNDYLGCYANKLADAGKLHFTKNVHVRLPGYKTPYVITSLYCDENYYSEANRARPCVQRF